MPTALITGATAGIGSAFADLLALRGWDLVLVARDVQRLAAQADRLRHAHDTDVEVLPVDLATDEGCARIEWRCGEGLDLLVNNAGISNPGVFHTLSRDSEEHLLRLNVRAVMRLTHAALPPMVQRGQGAVVNVSSVAGWTPGPTSSTYGASKAWVTAFSRALHLQYAPQGVRVLALCPGYTRTEFHDRAGMDVSGIPEPLWLDAHDVARTALDDLERGRAVSVPGATYKAVVLASRLVPEALYAAVARRLRGRLPDRR